MDLYCTIFVDADFGSGPLYRLIQSDISYILDILDIYYNNNDDYHASLKLRPEDGFLYYRWFLDIEPKPNITPEEYIAAVGSLLCVLWRAGCKAVAACDFEDELPRRGGYGSGNEAN